MPSIVNAEGISKSFTGKVLLDKVNLSIQEGEKVGVVGINGTGKSTLLRILAGDIDQDMGEVIRKKGLVSAYLPQSPEFDPESDLLSAVRTMALRNKNTLAFHGDSKDFDAKIKSMLNRFGLSDFSIKTGYLSGGQRKRAALAAVLLTPADLIILDEPTNHLDFAMTEWLEKYLGRFNGSILFITHDRYFLDSVASRIVEISHGKIYSYDSDYEGYLSLKAEREQMEASAEHTRQNVLRKELAWMRRGARARGTKQKAHIAIYEDLLKQDKPIIDKTLEMRSAGSLGSRMGKSTIELEGIEKGYDGKVLIRNFSYTFQHHDRVGFIGRNGCGKTTLMRIISGKEKPDKGSVKIGQTIKTGCFNQEISDNIDNKGSIEYMDPEKKVIDYIKDTAEYIRTSEGLVSAGAMLERFLFSPDEQYSKIEKLSGGEKKRLNLLRVLMENPNVLILDEPTNDLDTESLAVLEDFLDEFDGIVITVSHDRYFMDRVVSRLFVFQNDGSIKGFEGGYTDYIKAFGRIPGEEQILIQKNEEAKKEESDSKKTWTHEKKVKFTYQEAKEWETIEDEIDSLERRLDEIGKEMVRNASDYGKLAGLQKEKEDKEALLDQKMERWEYLSEINDKMNE